MRKEVWTKTEELVTHLWLAPTEYATIVSADDGKPMTDTFPLGMGSSMLEDGTLLGPKNITKEAFQQEIAALEAE